MKRWQIAAVALLVVAVGVGALFGGKAWGESTSSSDRPEFSDGNAPARGDGSFPGDGSGDASGAGRLGGNMVTGSIIAADSSSITVQTDDGSTKIVLVSDSTGISLVTDGSATDLTTGEDVVVTGTTNDDGTVTATNIRLGEVAGLGGAPGDAPLAGSDTATTDTASN